MRKVLLWTMVGAAVLGLACSGPGTTPTPGLLWVVDNGIFYTKDVARAQEQMPFRIILPRFIPGGAKGDLLPTMTGPLRDNQPGGDAQVRITYPVISPGDVKGRVSIAEWNGGLLETTDARYEYVNIKGMKVEKIEGQFQWGPGVEFEFTHGGTGYWVGVYNFTYEEAVKVVESMIEQLQ